MAEMTADERKARSLCRALFGADYTRYHYDLALEHILAARREAAEEMRARCLGALMDTPISTQGRAVYDAFQSLEAAIRALPTKESEGWS